MHHWIWGIISVNQEQHNAGKMQVVFKMVWVYIKVATEHLNLNVLTKTVLRGNSSWVFHVLHIIWAKGPTDFSYRHFFQRCLHTGIPLHFTLLRLADSPFATNWKFLATLSLVSLSVPFFQHHVSVSYFSNFSQHFKPFIIIYYGDL